jgi:hypothetical protein
MQQHLSASTGSLKETVHVHTFLLKYLSRDASPYESLRLWAVNVGKKLHADHPVQSNQYGPMNALNHGQGRKGLR